MRPGRKILNLRHDRHISQQDLARLCEITPSALSKIEAGINSPRANIICRIAEKLGVTMEYLLDEGLPYPYSGTAYRQRLLDGEVDPEATIRMEVTNEEKAFLEALRGSPRIVRELAMSLPEESMESIRLAHFAVRHSQVENPGPQFLAHFETLLKTGEFEAGRSERVPTKKTSKRGAAKKNTARAKKTSKSRGKSAASKKRTKAKKSASSTRRKSTRR